VQKGIYGIVQKGTSAHKHKNVPLYNN